MRLMVGHRAGGVVIALAVGVSLVGTAFAQEEPPFIPASAGVVTGEVDRCLNGAETPASQVAIGIDGGASNMARSDINGQFVIALPPGQYTVIALADDGSFANRYYVPVEAGQALDIGILDLGGGLAGCAPDADLTAPVLPTFTPVPTAVPAVPTPTPEPTSPPPTATPVPAPPPPEPTPAAD
jgi:hypothetical protein